MVGDLLQLGLLICVAHWIWSQVIGDDDRDTIKKGGEQLKDYARSKLDEKK